RAASADRRAQRAEGERRGGKPGLRPGGPRRIAVAQDPRFQEHRGPQGHPERPERLEAVARAVDERAARLTPVAPRSASDAEILRVHGAEHLAALSEAVRRAPARLDPDTFVSAESLAVARLAAGTTVELALGIAGGRADAGLAAVRPPGHHAEGSRAMGFCLLNHVAIAARALQADAGLERILIVDWDVHHGNGTQHSFEDDPSVLYVSTHQFPYYPGTGDVSEAGRGRGEGATLNVPLPAGSGDPEHVGALLRILVPAARTFRPDFVLVSCGFDAHADDPLASMEVTREGYAALAAVVRTLSDELCGGRLLLVLEGGYALSGLYEGTSAVLDVLLSRTVKPPVLPPLAPGDRLERVLARVAAVHASRIPGLGAP
ncbi:MAG: histone deacetylase, partial [Myxococcota bacterium]